MPWSTPTACLVLVQIVPRVLVAAGVVLQVDPDFLAARVAGPDVLFTMPHAGCLGGEIADAQADTNYLGSLALNASWVTCPDGDGLRFVGPSPSSASSSAPPPQGGLAFSTSTFQGLATPTIQNVSIEAWLSVPSNDTDTQDAVVFSIADGAEVRFKVYQSSDARLYFWSAGGDSTVWGHAALPEDAAPWAVHVVITATVTTRMIASGLRQQIVHRLYLNGVHNGVTDSRSALDRRTSYWNESSRLYLFAEPVARTGWANWNGTFHLFSLYNRTLSAVEVAQNYAARVPNSRPLARAANHTVQENGEVGSHYDTPAFYLSPVPVDELVVLDLVAVDGDLEPASPNYNAAAPLSPPQLYLASLPGEGTLYHLNGSAITEVPTLLVSSAATQPGVVGTQVRYRPGWKEVSWPEVYTTFAFYALDGSTGLAGAPATVSVLVRPVHRIPEVNSSTTPTEAKAGQLTWVTVAGTAFDGAVLTWARLASLPSQGSLYRSLNDTATPLGVGADVPMPPGQLVYLYTGPQASLSSSALATDAFNVTVVDSYSTSSVPAAVNLVVAPSLEALAQDTALTVPEHTPTPVTLLGTDHQSLAHRDLCFEITALPRHGVLRLPTDQSLVASVPFRLPDQVSPFPYTTGAAVLYESVPGYFTQPNHTWNGTWFEDDEDEGFAFRVVACQGEGEGNATVSSPPVEQRLAVQNVNDPTDITAPTLSAMELSVLGLGTLAPVDARLDRVDDDVLVLTGWHLVDADRDVDPVLVRISAAYGIVRLNPRHLFLADFTSVRYCQSWGTDDRDPTNTSAPPLRCQGSGEDRAMVFVASPLHLYQLLEGMEYRSALTNVVDTIQVTVYDGQTMDGGADGCLPAWAFNSTSLRPGGCWVATANVTVHVGASALLESLQSGDATQTVPTTLWFALGGVVLFVLLAGGTVVWHRRQHQHQQR